MAKHPLYPHVSKKREVQYPHTTSFKSTSGIEVAVEEQYQEETPIPKTNWQKAVVEANRRLTNIDIGRESPELTYNTQEYETAIDNVLSEVAKQYVVPEIILRKQILWQFIPGASVERPGGLSDDEIEKLLSGVRLIRKPTQRRLI